MEINLIYKWVEEAEKMEFGESRITSVKYFDEQIIIYFNSFKFLQLNFSAQNSFCFFPKRVDLPKKVLKKCIKLESYLKDCIFKEVKLVNNDRILDFSWQKTGNNDKIKFHLFVELIPGNRKYILTGENKRIIAAKYFDHPPRNGLNDYIAKEYNISTDRGKKEFYQRGNYSKVATIDPKNMNDTFFDLYYNEILYERNENIRRHKIKNLTKEINKKNRKIGKLEKELHIAESENKWLQYAELLKVNLSKIKRGMPEIEVTNYYSTDIEKIKIPLEKDKSARENCERYFKKYKKAKRGKKIIGQQIDLAKIEVRKLEEAIAKLENAENKSFLFEENKPVKGKKSKDDLPRFKSIQVDENWEILIGRSAKENDLLVTKIGKPYDWWFHTRIYHGSHIILRNFAKRELPENLKNICCRLAAYHSKAKKSQNIPVDYTQLRYIRKPRGSAPGLVTYTVHKTLFVNPLSTRDAGELIKEGKNVGIE